MTKSPAHFEQPNTSKGRAATQEKELKPGKSDIPQPRDFDYHRLAKDKLGLGFSGNAVDTLVRGANPAAGKYRNPPEHKYKLPGSGADGGAARVEQQNRLAGKSKR